VVLADGTEKDTDNNSNDFELQNPTPFAKNKTYVFSDNQPTPPPPVVDTTKKILINEIQIDSIEGKGGTDDDWVELYNPNDESVSLKGWSIQKFSSDDPCSLAKGYYKKNFPDDAVIKGKSYFLLASTQANDWMVAV
jgi:hypothetical protein